MTRAAASGSRSWWQATQKLRRKRDSSRATPLSARHRHRDQGFGTGDLAAQLRLRDAEHQHAVRAREEDVVLAGAVAQREVPGPAGTPRARPGGCGSRRPAAAAGRTASRGCAPRARANGAPSAPRSRPRRGSDRRWRCARSSRGRRGCPPDPTPGARSSRRRARSSRRACGADRCPLVVNDCMGTILRRLPLRAPSLRRCSCCSRLRQGAVAGQHLGDAGVGLAVLRDRPEELAVLQLDPVHRHVDVGHVDLLLLAVDQVVVARDVGAVVADVAEEGARAGRRC